MNKKAIAILGAIFILIVGTLGFLVYSKYANKSSPPVAQTPPADNGTSTQQSASSTDNSASATPVEPAAPASNIVKLTSDQVVSPSLFFNGQGITYFDNQGNLFQSSLQDIGGQVQLSQKKQLNIPAKPNISRILWPARGDDFIAEFTDVSGKKSWSYFNSAAGQYADLPPQVESVDWMPNGAQIVYVWLDNGKATLSMANPDATNYKSLAEMWETDDELHVSPDGTQILYFETGNTGAANAVNSVTIDGKVWKGLVKNGFNSGVLWSPDGQKFLFGKKDINTQKYQLWVYNLTSGEVKNLGLFTTVDKAVWDQDSNVVYAAVPDSGTAGAGGLTADSFWRMDISTLEKKQYASDGSTLIDGRNLFLNTTSDKLFFKNAQDGGLYYLDLTQ